MNSLLSDYLCTIYSPRSSLQQLIAKDYLIRISLFYIAMPVMGYTMMYIFLTIGHGAPSTLTPWLNIPKQEYYSINRFLLAPSMIICWFTATAFIQVVSRLLGGKGSFEQTLAAVALSISISMWAALLHDLPMSFLSATGIINAAEHEVAMNSPTVYRTLLWIFYSAYFIAFLILFPLTVQVVHQLNRAKSIVIGTLAFFLFQTLFLVFNR